MSNRYRVAGAPKGWPEGLPFKLRFPDGEYGIGDEFEHEFDSADDEQANLDSGLLEVVPRTYKVIGESDVFETPPGGEFDKALTMGQEAHLIDGGFIKRVDAKNEPAEDEKKPARKKKAAAE